MIARGYPSPRDAQWGCFEQDQADALASIGHDVVVLSVDSRLRWYMRKPGTTHRLRKGVHYYNCFWLPEKLSNLLGGTRLSDYVKKVQITKLYETAIKRHGSPDVLYGQFFFNSYLALHLRDKYGVPVVGIEHAARFNEDHLDAETLRLSTYTYAHVDETIAVSESLSNSLKRHFGVKPVVVHNMAGPEFVFNPSAPRDSRKLTFVSTGSLVPRKGFDLLIEALSQCGLPQDSWQLNLIGDGESRDQLQKQIQHCGLQGSVHLLGHHTKTEIAHYLQQADVFILPSRNENFSVAVLEALACGLPVIASICGGIRECIDERNGLLFPVDDKEALVSALRYMYHHYKDYDRRQIAEDCQNRFSTETIAKKLTAVFEKAVGRSWIERNPSICTK